MEFLEAAADWADRAHVDLKFARDQYDGWFAILEFSDAMGPFSGIATFIDRRGKRTSGKGDEKVVILAETMEEYSDRVSKHLSKVATQARRKRIERVTRAPIRAAA
jgi:hypothetical protein